MISELDVSPETNSNDEAARSGLVSIVIAVKNRQDSLARLLASIERQDYQDREIVVVDDGSEPPIRPDLAGVKWLRNQQSLGATVARNSGMTLSRGEFIVIFDDDVELRDTTLLTRAVALARRFPGCGAIGFRQLQVDGSPNYMQPSVATALAHVGQFFSYGNLLRAQALQRVGMFEPSFRYYHEETELSLRLLDAGYEILYDPSLAVVHYQDPRGRNYKNIYRLLLRNSILTALMRCPLWCVPPAVGAALARHRRWTKDQQRADYSGMVWAAREVWQMMPYVRANRRPIKFATLQLKRNLTRHPRLVGSC